MPDVEEQPEDRPGDQPEAVDDPLVEFVTVEKNARQWLAAIRPILTLCVDGTEVEPRVRLDWDRMKVAVCERVIRIMQSDLPEDQRTPIFFPRARPDASPPQRD